MRVTIELYPIIDICIALWCMVCEYLVYVHPGRQQCKVDMMATATSRHHLDMTSSVLKVTQYKNKITHKPDCQLRIIHTLVQTLGTTVDFLQFIVLFQYVVTSNITDMNFTLYFSAKIILMLASVVDICLPLIILLH